MVITAVQTMAFFENPDQMGIPHAMVVQLQVEGIAVIQDLARIVLAMASSGAMVTTYSGIAQQKA